MAEISTKLTFARDIMAAINCNFAALISGVNTLSIKYEKNRLEVIEINEKIKNILFQQETDCKKDEHSSTLQLDQNIININNQRVREASSSNEILFTLETTQCEHITFNDYGFKKNNKFEIGNNINNVNIKSGTSSNSTAYNLVLSSNNNYSHPPTKNKTISDCKIDDIIGFESSKNVLKNQSLKKQSVNNNTDIKSVKSSKEKTKNKNRKKEKKAKKNGKKSTCKNSRGKARKAKRKIQSNNIRKKKIQNIKKKPPDQKQPPDEYNDNYDFDRECSNCGYLGHTAKDCDCPIGTCDHCGQYGHYSRACGYPPDHNFDII